MKIFYQQNVYDWLEGYTSMYGAGFVWRRKLDNFWDIFRFWRKEQQPMPMRPQQPMPGMRQPTMQRDSLQTDSLTTTHETK